MFETLETKDRRRVLLFGAAVVVLALVAVVEGGYIAWHRNAPNRYKPVTAWDEWDGFIAFDTATGQLCRTIRVGRRPSPAASNAPATHPAQESQPSKSWDPILDAINGVGHFDREAAERAARATEAEEAREAEFFRSLPACVDIR